MPLQGQQLGAETGGAVADGVSGSLSSNSVSLMRLMFQFRAPDFILLAFIQCSIKGIQLWSGDEGFGKS